ncbi:MAG: HNH endonuclease [Barrevirus sp.]|uniref:HNH endonuclease n=1 Tax=Barrevirus sp. TaxID=2487763 RepID=A0A3G4ZQ31_9VIRU|nr:MAG: HNH endonuclease [Barrevirus sp.]
MEIQLGGKLGGVTIVSPEDHGRVSEHKWHDDGEGYATATIDGTNVRLNRFIKCCPENLEVDHINRNTFDNRSENLKICTQLENSQNTSVRKNKTSSDYRGVFFDKATQKFRVLFVYYKEQISLGSFDDEIDAAICFDMYIVHNNITEKELNFPDKRNEYLNTKYIPYVKKKSGKYIGVIFLKRDNKYAARIYINGKNNVLLRSEDEVQCAKAYDKYIVDNSVPNKKKLNFPNDYPNYKEILEIKTEFKPINSKTIRLILNSSPESEVIIDKEDYDKIKNHCWYLNDDGYVVATIGGDTTRIHKFIMNSTISTEFIDHIDSNPLNNIKSNLRRSNKHKNPQNQSKREGASSKYHGVNVIKTSIMKRWKVFVAKHYVGTYIDEISAARARDLYIIINIEDPHYKFNFADWDKKEVRAEWEAKLAIPKNNSEK